MSEVLEVHNIWQQYLLFYCSFFYSVYVLISQWSDWVIATVNFIPREIIFVSNKLNLYPSISGRVGGGGDDDDDDDDDDGDDGDE